MDDHNYQHNMSFGTSDEQFVEINSLYLNNENNPQSIATTPTNTQKAITVHTEQNSTFNTEDTSTNTQKAKTVHTEQNSTSTEDSTNELEQSIDNNQKFKIINVPVKAVSTIDPSIALDSSIFCSEMIMKEFESEDTSGELKALLNRWSMQELYPFFVRKLIFRIRVIFFLYIILSFMSIYFAFLCRKSVVCWTSQAIDFERCEGTVECLELRCWNQICVCIEMVQVDIRKQSCSKKNGRRSHSNTTATSEPDYIDEQ